MTMTNKQRFECWEELRTEYENIRDEHAEDVDLDWTRSTNNYVMDRRLYSCYCRISNLIRMRLLINEYRTIPTFIREHVAEGERSIIAYRPFGFKKTQFDRIVKKYPRIRDSTEYLPKKQILENIDNVMCITNNTINSINRRNLMARNIAPEPPQQQLLKPNNVERLQDILMDLDSEKEKISEGLYLRLCNKLMGLKVE